MDSSARAQRSKKVQAILAGGMVLGLGAAITLAVWTDNEWATGTFSAGAFNMEGSTDGVLYEEHEVVGDAAALSFSVDFDNLSPDQTVAAPFAVRLDDATTTGATVVPASATGSGTAEANLTYGVVQVASVAACLPDATGSATIVPAGTALDSVSVTPGTFALAQGTGGNPGAPVFLCVQVTSESTLEQGQTAAGTWQFEATSD